jgi:hypothetical protein
MLAGLKNIQGKPKPFARQGLNQRGTHKVRIDNSEAVSIFLVQYQNT